MSASFEVSIEILMRAHHEKFDRSLVQYAVSQQALSRTYAEPIHLNSGQIAHLSLTCLGPTCNKSHGLVERLLLRPMEFLNGTFEC